MRLYVVGTDTGVGKTRVTAALACAAAGRAAIVKLVQTGLPPGVAGDAEEAAALADAARALAPAAASAIVATTSHEIARFLEPADPWNAAIAEGAATLEPDALVRAVERLPGDLIIEGSGGAAVPLDARTTLSDVARRLDCAAVLVVGLRLGCINHAFLTLAYLEGLGIPVRGLVTTGAFGPTSDSYRRQVERALATKTDRVDHLAWATDAARSVADAAARLSPLLENRRCTPPSIPLATP